MPIRALRGSHLYIDFHLPCPAARRTGRGSRAPPGRGEVGGAGALVFHSNRFHAFVPKPEPLVPWCPHSNRGWNRPVFRPSALGWASRRSNTPHQNRTPQIMNEKQPTVSAGADIAKATLPLPGRPFGVRVLPPRLMPPAAALESRAPLAGRLGVRFQARSFSLWISDFTLCLFHTLQSVKWAGHGASTNHFGSPRRR